MEDPVTQTGKKKPAFAFWERQRKDSTSAPNSAAPAPAPAIASATSSTSPSTARRIDALGRGTSTSPSPSTQRTASSQQAGSSTGSGLSGVQRLIQQYSQSGSAGISNSSSSSLDRSLSGRRINGASPQPIRIASSGSQALSAAAEAVRPNGRADNSPTSVTFAQETPMVPPPPPPSEQLSTATNPSTTPSSRLSTEVVASEASSSACRGSATQIVTSSSHQEEARHADISSSSSSSKDTDAEKARRRRRLLQEQLRKRNSKRRSAGAVEVTESSSYSSDEQDDLSTTEAAIATADPSAASAFPNEDNVVNVGPTHAPTPSSSSRRARLISESDSLPRIGSGTESDPYHDAHSRMVTPSKPTARTVLPSPTATAVATTHLNSSARRATGRPPSLEDTRPWLEFSPLLPDSELLDSPEKGPPPSFALLHQSASSDLSASASQSSVATDPNLAGSVRPSPSRSNSASLFASDSPVSPTGLGFSTPPGYPSTSSYLSINSPTHSTHTRAYRSSSTKLPPPRPSPQAPLPPPPSVASSTASSGSRTAAAAGSSGAAAAPTRSVRSSSIRHAAQQPSLQGEPDVFGGQSLRSRSYSLEQEVASADEEYQRMPPQPTPSAATAQATKTASRRDSSDATAASSLAVPMIRQRSNSLQRKDREALEAPTRPVKLTQSNSSPPNAIATSSRTSSSKTPTMGRPRGFTVGAVPGPPGTLRAGAPAQAPAKSRPRSLLSNEIFPLDLAEPRYKSRSGREDDDNARKTYSMDIDRRGSSLSTNPAAFRGSGGVGISRGISVTSATERESLSSSGERLAPDSSTDRRPSVGGRSRSGSSASLLQQVNSQPKSHASFVIAVVGHAYSGKSTVIKKGLRQFGLSKPHVLSEKVTSHSTVCVVDQEQRTIEVLEIDASVLLNGPSKRFAWPKFLPHIDAVILCYDASEIASFRGMSELLENFAVANLSTVMLACKSEVHPKAVDPYYASDMACIYNVGLAECTVQSEEGKKRMRDCFSYLVKEVAKARSGRARKGPASTVPPTPAAMSSQRSQSPGAPGQAVPQTRTPSNISQASSQSSVPRSMIDTGSSSVDAATTSNEPLPSPAAPIDSIRARGYSNASSALGRGPAGGSDASTDEALTASAIEQTMQAMSNLDMASDSSGASLPLRNITTSTALDTRFSPRKMSSATVASVASDAPSFRSEEDGVLHESLHRAQMGLQNARSSGGYVSIEELWDKLFHAAISRTDERFVTMFMVFFRGFATPIDLLEQMMSRFDSLTAEDVADGLVHRFALIRLTNMLGDWVLDYPGDLSDPDTHALLVRYHRQLLRHPDTVHTAAQIHAAVDATANAVDLDALWSKTVNSDQTRHKGTSAAAAIVAAQQGGAGTGAGSEGDGAGGWPASQSSGSTSGLMASSGNTSHDFDGLGHSSGRSAEEASESHERTGSESSLPMHPELGASGRSRSASDLTTSSTEGAAVFYKDGKQIPATGSSVSTVSGATQSSGHSAGGSTSQSGTATNASAASSTANLVATPDPIGTVRVGSLDQKTVLRSISNTLMEIDDETIASELTRLEWTFFTAIQPRDLLRHILVPHDKRDGPVSRSISHFNYISNWVCSMILAQGKTKHRARMLEKFFNIASILRHANDYGSLNSVLGGLSKTAVHRLKHTRELLKGKAVNKAYQSLVRLMSNERSSAAYRLALENSDGPTTPYVGVHLQDILSISDGNPSKRASDGMIHWRKFSLMDEAVTAVARCQQYDRYTKPNPAVERLIVDVPIMDDEALYERSLLVEPRSNGGTGVGASKIKDLKTFLSNQTYSSNSGGAGGAFHP